MSSIDVASAGPLPRKTEFRQCQYTGLKVDIAAQTLIKVNAVAAVVFLAIGGLFGLLVALTRWPAVHLLSSEMFYLVLTAHGADVLVFWIVFFEVAVLYFASAVLLNCRLAAPKIGWLAFILMLVGALVANVAVLQGESSVMFTSYPPLMAKPHFYLGLIVFAVGALLATALFFATLVIAKEALNGLEPRDVDRGYRWEQGFTLEMYMHEDSQKSRDAFVETGKAAKF